MLRLLRYLPVVLSLIGVIRKNRKNATPIVKGRRARTRRSTFRK